MKSISEVCSLMRMQKIPLTKACRVKRYLKLEDKQKFCDEFSSLVEEHVSDFPKLRGYIPLVFLDLLTVKYYTDINVEMTYEFYDGLMESGIMGQLTEEIKDEYQLMMKLVVSYMSEM